MYVVTDIICCPNSWKNFTRIQMVKHGNIVSVTLREDQDLKENIDSYVVQIVKKSRKSRSRTQYTW